MREELKWEDRAQFARKLIEFRAMNKWTQVDLSKATGISSGLIGMWESKRGNESNAMHHVYHNKLKELGCDLTGLVRIHNQSRKIRIDYSTHSPSLRVSKIIKVAADAIALAKKALNDVDEHYKRLEAQADILLKEMDKLSNLKHQFKAIMEKDEQ